jgi:uncharacterized protein YegL
MKTTLNGLYSQSIEKQQALPQVTGVNYYVVVDVSGSMSGELHKIRAQLKNKVSSLLRDDDTLTIVWFSSDSQCGVLKENVKVTNLVQLNDLHAAIDRFLKPMSCTAFRKPLELVKSIIDNYGSSNPNVLIFLTDGYNNDCSWKDVMQNLSVLNGSLASSMFVEYGYYADSSRLSEMASLVGGEKVTSSSFDDYDSAFTRKLSTPLLSTKKIKVALDKTPSRDFVYSIDNGEVILYSIVDGHVLVGQDIDKVYYTIDGSGNTNAPQAMYALAFLLSDKMRVEDTEDVLSSIGDVRMINMYANAFGKQKLFEFKSELKKCIYDDSYRFNEGMNTSHMIDDEKYCVVELIEDLQDHGALFHPLSEHFEYNRISAAMEDKDEFTDEQKQLVENASSVNELEAILEKIKKENFKLKFVPNNKNKGYTFDDLVYHEDRANISVRVRIDGHVMLPNNEYGIDIVNTFVYRTYNIIKDGIVNITKIPVSFVGNIGFNLSSRLFSNGVMVFVPDPNSNIMVIDFSSLPTINRSMYKNMSAVKLAKLSFDLCRMQAMNKVFKASKDSKSVSMVEKYGEEATNWLNGLGFTDFSGFSPKLKKAEPKDSYVAIELLVKIKGLSSLPKVDDVVKKVATGKPLTISESLINEAIFDYNTMIRLTESLKKSNPGVCDDFIAAKVKEVNDNKKNLMREISKQKFSMILSRKWFHEFKSMDENTIDIVVDGKTVAVTFEYAETTIEI